MNMLELREWILLVIQAATLIALIVYVIKTSEMAAATRDAADATSQALSEARESRLAEMAPRIMVYLDPNMTYMANIIIENVGRGTAKQVSFSWNPRIRVVEQPNQYDPMKFFETPKAMFPPGFRVRHLLDAWPNLFSSELPDRYEVSVQYEGVETQRKYSVSHVLDIAAMKDRTDSYDKDMSDLVEAWKKHTDKLDRGLKTIGDRLSDLSIAGSYVPEDTSDGKTAVMFLLAYWKLYEESRQVEEAYVPWRLYLHQLRRYALGAFCRVQEENGPQEVLSSLRAIVIETFGLRAEHPALGSDTSKAFDEPFENLKASIDGWYLRE